MIKSYTLLNEKTAIRFQIDSGLFFCVFSTMNGGHSVGFVVNKGDFSFEKIDQTILEAHKSLKVEFGKVLVKVVGTVSLLEQWKNKNKTQIKLIERNHQIEVIYIPHEGRIRVADITRLKTENILPIKKNPSGPIKVLVVDDSKTIRTLLKGVISADSELQLIADTGSPNEVISLIEKHKPDVITLDIHMPEMDGVTLLKKYIVNHPIPTIMISSISVEEGPLILNALESGAVDYLKKPELNELAEASALIIEKIKSAAGSMVFAPTIRKAKTTSHSLSFEKNGLIAIGSSTGGTEALRKIMIELPAEIPPILIVQHIPPIFSKAFANRINDLCPFTVQEAVDGDIVKNNNVYIAPGGKQMKVFKGAQGLTIKIDDSAPVNRHKPSVDVLFQSLSEQDIKNGVAVMLTGMGGDGAQSMLKLFKKGWQTIAQNKETCVVFGMPNVAIQAGAVQHICPLDEIPEKMQQLLAKKIAA